jgi:hypothetical protein
MNRMAELTGIAAELDRRGRFVEADQVEELMNREAQSRWRLENPFGPENQHAQGKSPYVGFGVTGLNSDSPFFIGPGGLTPNIFAITGLNKGRMQERRKMDILRRHDPNVTLWDRFQGTAAPGSYNRRTEKELYDRIDPQKVEAYKRLHGGAPINRTPFGTRPNDRKIDPAAYNRIDGIMPQRPSQRPFDERPSREPAGNI